jgi:hypothetical protein
MNKIETIFNDFLSKNQGDKKIKSRTDIEKLLKGWSITEISSEEKYWSREISLDNVMLGIDGFGGCFIFSGTHFFYKSSGFSKTYFFEPLEKFLHIGGYPKTPFKFGSITYEGNSIGNISTSKNEIFEIIERIKNELINPYLELKTHGIDEVFNLQTPTDDTIEIKNVNEYLSEKFLNFKENTPGLLGYEEVIELSKKTFSLSNFSKKKDLIQLLNTNKFLFAFNFGIIITKNKLIFCPSGNLKIFEIEFEDIHKIKVVLHQSKIFYGEHYILLTKSYLEHSEYFISFQKLFSQVVVQRIKDEKEELQRKIIEEQKLKEEQDEKRRVHELEELKNKIYNIPHDLDSYKFYFSNIKSVGIESKWGSRDGRLDYIKTYGNKNFQQTNKNQYFYISGGLFFSDEYVEYIYPENGIRYSKRFYQYKGYHEYSSGFPGPEGLKLFLESDYPYMLDKEHINDEPIKSTLKIVSDFIRNCVEVRIQKEKDIADKLEKERVISLNSKRGVIISSLDKDGNGEVDLVDSDDFNKILNLNQKTIIDIDRTYIQKFVKISIYLKTKKTNTQKIFQSLKETKTDSELEQLSNLLKNQIYFHDLLVFHSISMITSLIEQDLITFYEIYECFDQFGIFNSNWENEVSQKLSDINLGIKDLMYSIYHMEKNIVNSINNLTYVTQDSFSLLRGSIEKQLNNVNSSIIFNNLLTTVQTYKMYQLK